jgi:hypothetical protein
VEEVRSTPSVKLAVQYPQFDLCTLDHSLFCDSIINLMLDPSVYPFITPYPIHVAPSSNFGPDSDAGMDCDFLELPKFGADVRLNRQTCRIFKSTKLCLYQWKLLTQCLIFV